MLTREPANYKKINIESDDIFELFWEHRESKAKFYHIKACDKNFSNLKISDFYLSFYCWKEGTASQNEDLLIPRYGNAKKLTASSIL